MAEELTRRDFTKAGLATTLGVAAGAAQGLSEASASAAGPSANGPAAPSAVASGAGQRGPRVQRDRRPVIVV